MTEEAINPLRRKLIEDMTVRNLDPSTQREYIGAVRRSGSTPHEDQRTSHSELQIHNAGPPSDRQLIAPTPASSHASSKTEAPTLGRQRPSYPSPPLSQPAATPPAS